MPKTMTDEERYGKVGAEIRKLDPEAYKNRPGTAEGNMKLLKELRAKAAKSSSREADSEDYTTNRPKRASSSDESERKTFAPDTKAAPKATPVVKEDRIAAQRENAARSAARDAAAAAERMARDKPPAPRITPRPVAPTSEIPSDRIAAQRVNAARSAARDAEAAAERMARDRPPGMKRGGSVKKYAGGGSVSSASKRADGCATKGKTKGRFV